MARERIKPTAEFTSGSRDDAVPSRKKRRKTGPRPPPDPTTLGGRLTIARRDRGLTQTQVGQHVGVQPQSVSAWEKDEAEPSVERIKALADLYEMKVADLIDHPSTLAELADKAQHQLRHDVLAQEPARRISYGSDTARLRSLLRNLIHVGEFHLLDVEPATHSLSDLPEIYVWRLPRHVFSYTRSTAELRVTRMLSDALIPNVLPGDFLLIDCAERKILGTRGLYIVSDGFAIMIRQIEPFGGKEGETWYRLSSPNPEVPLREIRDLRILGRIVGKLAMFF